MLHSYRMKKINKKKLFHDTAEIKNELIYKP